MTIELLMALMLFAFVSSITPGPNNLMIMSSGTNFGFRLSLPHLLGISLGFMLMIVLVGTGVMQLFALYPPLSDLLKLLSVAYLLYLAAKIAMTNTKMEDGEVKSKPLTFVQAALFQWVNPKAWTMALTSISVYAPSNTSYAILSVAAVFGSVNLPCVSVWMMLGIKIKRFLTSPKRLRVFNVCMALLLVSSLVSIFGINMK